MFMLSSIDPAIVLSMFMLSFIDPAIVLSMFMLSSIDPAIVLSMFMLSFSVVIVCGLYMIALPLEIQLSRGYDAINRFNTATFFGFPTSYVAVSFLCDQWVQLRWEVIVCFVDIGGIIDHHFLNFLLITTCIYIDLFT